MVQVVSVLAKTIMKHCVYKYSLYKKENSIKLSFLNLLNFLNGIIHLPFLELSIIIFRDIKMRTWKWSANSIEPGRLHGRAGWPGYILLADQLKVLTLISLKWWKFQNRWINPFRKLGRLRVKKGNKLKGRKGLTSDKNKTKLRFFCLDY